MSQRKEHTLSPTPLRFTLESESKSESMDEWVSSPSGHACARIFPDKVLILTSKSENEFKKPIEIVIEEPNVKAIVFLKTAYVQNQLVFATKNGIKVYDMHDPKKTVHAINFDKPYDEADFSTVKMFLAESSTYFHEITERTVFIIHQTKTSSETPEINLIKVNLLSSKIERVKIHSHDALDVNRSVIRDNQLLCANRNSKLECFSVSDGKQCEASWPYVAESFKAFNNLKDCTIHNIWTEPDLKFTRCSITALHFEDSSKTHSLRIYNDNERKASHIRARVNFAVAPLIIKRELFYLEADSNDIYLFDSFKGESIFIFHTSLKNPRHLLPAGEGNICVEGNDENGKLVYQMFAFSEAAKKAQMRVHNKKEVGSTISGTLLNFLSPDPAGIVMSYLPNADIPDKFLTGRMNAVPNLPLSAIDPNHRFFSDKTNHWIWDASRVDKNGGMHFIPLSGYLKVSEVIWLGNNRIAQICNKEKLIVYKLIETSMGCEAQQETKELDFPIKLGKYSDSEFLTCQLPDSRVLITHKNSDVIYMIDLPPKQNTTTAAHYFKEIMSLKGAQIYTLNILHPNFLRVTVDRPETHNMVAILFQIQCNPGQRACSLKEVAQKNVGCEINCWVTHTNHALTYQRSMFFLSKEFNQKVALDSDVLIHIFREGKVPQKIKIEMLPDDSFLFAQNTSLKERERIHIIDILIYDLKTKQSRVLIESSPEKEITNFFLINGGTLGLQVRNTQVQYSYEFHNLPEIRSLYKQTPKIDTQVEEKKKEIKSDAPVQAETKSHAPTHFFRTKLVVLSSEQTILIELTNLIEKYTQKAQKLLDRFTGKELPPLEKEELDDYQDIKKGLEYILTNIRTSDTKKIDIISEAKKLFKTFSNFVDTDLEAKTLIKKIIELNPKNTATP